MSGVHCSYTCLWLSCCCCYWESYNVVSCVQCWQWQAESFAASVHAVHLDWVWLASYVKLHAMVLDALHHSNGQQQHPLWYNSMDNTFVISVRQNLVDVRFWPKGSVKCWFWLGIKLLFDKTFCPRIHMWLWTMEPCDILRYDNWHLCYCVVWSVMID